MSEPTPEPRAAAWWRSRWTLAALGPLAWLGLRLAASAPEQVERWYSQGLFPWVRDSLTANARLLPGSLAQLLLGLLILWLLARAWRGGLRWRRGEVTARRLAGNALSLAAALGGTGYALFVVVWGLNHARQPYAHHAALELGSPAARDDADGDSSGRLAALAAALAADCSSLRAELDLDSLTLRPDARGQDPRLRAAFTTLAERVPVLAGPDPVLRRPLISPLLSRLGIAGIYSPFTAESHVNDQVPKWRHLYTAAHEIAHARGFAREDEANFIAWQVGRASSDPALRYSATASALSSVLVALGRVDPEAIRPIWDSLDGAVLSDFEDASRFWASHRSVATRVARGTNDLYLRSQGQAAGVQSYGRMVDLLLAEWEQGGATLPR